MQEKEQSKTYWIFILGAALCLSYVVPSQMVKTLIVAAVFYSAWIFKLCNPCLLLLVSNVVLNGEGNAILMLVACLPVYFSALKPEIEATAGQMITGAVFIFSMVASLFFGQDENVRTMVLFVLCFVALYNMGLQKLDMKQVSCYALLGVTEVLFALLYAWNHGGIQVMYGRLAIDDSIRTLANGIAVALALLLCCLFDKKQKVTFIKVIAALIAVIVLILTLSMGAIASVFALLLVLILCSDIEMRKKIVICGMLALMLGAVLLLTSSGGLFRVERLFEGDDGGANGRFEIWLTYWKEMSSKLVSTLFGFGPGDIRRLNIMSSYSHSLILDVLFSYGLVGFSVFLTVLGWILKRCISCKSATAIALWVFAVLLYATHSTATNSTFYLLLGISVAFTQNQEEFMES